MKKSIVIGMVALAGFAASCTNSATKADMSSDLDTLSYAIGMAQTQGLKDYLVQRVGVDTTYMDEFVKGLTEGATAGDDKKKAAYYAGVTIGQQIGGQMKQGINRELFGEDSTQTISMKNFMAGFIAGATGKGGQMSVEKAQELTRVKMEAIKKASMEKQYGDYKKKNEDFLANNKKNAKVKVLPSGLQYEVITEGKGEKPSENSMVKVNYRGTLIDGTEFDSSFKRNEPAKFRVNQVIKGWTEALQLMPVGSKWKLYIPQELAYGEREAGQIKPFSTLVFEVELVGIEKEDNK